MSDEQTASTEGATDQTSMADIASQIEVPAASADSKPSEVVTQPDNVSEFQHFVEKLDSLTAKVDSTAQKADSLANSQQETVLKQEIAEAVGKINEDVGGDEIMAELFLDKMAREDPNFKKVIDNRHANPAAFDKALGVISREWAAKNQNTIDPTVAENQRALKESQKTGSTVQVDSANQKLDAMPSGEFMNFAHKLSQGG